MMGTEREDSEPMPEHVFLATLSPPGAGVHGVYRTFDNAKLACEAAFRSGIWRHEDADQWTLIDSSDHQPIAFISRHELQD